MQKQQSSFMDSCTKYD